MQAVLKNGTFGDLEDKTDALQVILFLLKVVMADQQFCKQAGGKS